MRSQNTPRQVRAVVVSLLAASSVALAACGDDDDTAATTAATGGPATDTSSESPTTRPAPEPTPPTTAPPTTAPPTTAPPTTAPPEDAVVEIVLSDYAFGGLPESVPAGTRLQVQNISKKELHELIAFRLADDETRPLETLVALPPRQLEGLFAGPPAMVLLAPPGGPQIDAVGDGTLAEPGRYLVFCAIPTGADPVEYMNAAEQGGEGPPQVDGGPPHFMEGMYAEVTVT
jgi:hypothetical protein